MATRASVNTLRDSLLANSSNITAEDLRTFVTAVCDYVDTMTGTRPLIQGENMTPPYTEYQKTDIATPNVKMSVGMLGSPEANVSLNMDYATGEHRLYDTAKNATWIALGFGDSDGAGGVQSIFAVQHCKASAAAGDIWTLNGGNPFMVYMPSTASDQQHGCAHLLFRKWLIADGGTGNTGDPKGEIYMSFGRLVLGGAIAIPDAVDDAAAAALSPAVPVGGLYRTGSTLKIRVA